MIKKPDGPSPTGNRSGASRQIYRTLFSKKQTERMCKKLMSDTLLFAGFSHVRKSFAALFGHVSPILSGYAVFREELGTHAHTPYTGLDPAFDVFFGRLYTACNHQFGPGHRSEKAFDELSAEDVTGEALAEITAGFLSSTDFADCTAAGSVRNETTVADTGYFRIEERADNEACAELDVKSGSGGIHDRAYAHCHFRTLFGGKFYNFSENFMSKVASVSKFESANTSVIASFHNLLCNFGILVIEHRDNTGLAHLGENCDFIKFSHL